MCNNNEVKRITSFYETAVTIMKSNGGFRLLTSVRIHRELNDTNNGTAVKTITGLSREYFLAK